MVTPSTLILARKRQWLFAALMSVVTVNLTCVVLLLLQGVNGAVFFSRWGRSVLMAWPVVFISILWLAPLVMRLTNWLIPPTDAT